MNWGITSLALNLSALNKWVLLTLVFTNTAWAEPYSKEELNALRTPDEVKLLQLRSDEIAQLKSALGRRLPNNRKADLYVRLAEAYLEAYRAEFLMEGRAHEQRLAEGKADKYINRTHSKPILYQGIRASEEVIRLGIQHQKMDQIYYFLGVYHDELEDGKNAVKWFRELTKKFPDSIYIGEAYRVLAEDAYAKNNFREALGLYQAALRNYRGSSYPRLLQKTAWSHYRLRQYDTAVAQMKRAVAEASKDDKFLNLKDEALRDMALFMSEMGRVDEALKYFESVGAEKDYYPKALERLGAQYERNAEPKKAIQVYESLLKTNPKDEAAFRVRVKLFDMDIKRGQFNSALKRINSNEIPTSGDDDTEAAVNQLKSTIRRVAVERHDEFRKTQNRTALATANDYYGFYLNVFLSNSDSKGETPEIRMYLAEVKRELGESAVAAQLYREVLKSKDDRFAKQAAALWMASLGDAIKKYSSKKDKTDPETYNAIEKEFLEASSDVAKRFGTQPEGLEARLSAAQVLAGSSKRRSETEERISDLIEVAPGSSQALTAARLWLQMYADRLPKKSDEIKDAPETSDLRRLIEDLKKNSALMDADKSIGKNQLAQLIDTQEDRIRIGTIAGQEKSKDFASAGRGYEDFAKRQTDRGVVEKAYSNAVGAYVKVGDYDSAVRVISTWANKYRDSKAALESLRDTATNAIILGHFEKAAVLFRILGKRSDPNALEAAGRLFEGTGNLAEASNDFKSYLTLYKTGDRGLIALSLAQWFEYAKNDPQAIKYYKVCYEENSSTSAECGVRLSDLYARIENPNLSNTYLRKVADRAKMKDPSPWVGLARYKIAEAFERSKTFAPLRLPDDKLKQGLEARLKFLDQISKSYNTVVEASGPWAVAALDRLAQWVVHFADDVDAIEAPKGADPKAIEGFRKSLKSVSDPLRQKAVDTWKTAYQKGEDGELLSPVLPLIADKLADAGVATPARAQGFRDSWRLSGQAADGGREGPGAAFEKVRGKLLENGKDVQAWIDYGNLLWGEGKPLLAKIAYERALSLNPKAAAALNNRGVLIVSGVGQEDWIRATEANQFFKDALKKDELFLASKFNRGALLNYYRLFKKAKPYWTQVQVVAPQPDVIDGIAIAEQGLGQWDTAEKTFARADKAGAQSNRVHAIYHEAARASRKNTQQCVSRLKKLEDQVLQGFERLAYLHLKSFCKGEL